MDRRRLVWMTVFASALVAVIALAWALAVPSGDTAAAPRSEATNGADDGASEGSSPAGPSLTADSADPGDDESTTTFDSYPTLTRSPDTDGDGDAAPVPLAATSSLPRTTVTTGLAPTTSATAPSCIDPASNNTARCVTTTAPGPGDTGGICDTSVGRTTDPGCPGGTAHPTTASTMIDPCAVMTTFGCPGSTTAPAPPPTPPAPTATTAPPMTCYPVACPPTTRAVP